MVTHKYTNRKAEQREEQQKMMVHQQERRLAQNANALVAVLASTCLSLASYLSRFNIYIYVYIYIYICICIYAQALA